MTTESPRPPRRIGMKLLLMACTFLLADQIVQHFVLGTGPDEGWLLGRRVAPFDPPVFMPAQIATLHRLQDGTSLEGANFGDVGFDPELGWAPPPAGTSPKVTWSGARAGGPEVPQDRRPSVRRIATFGCSFTFGSEVDGPDAWPAQLDALRDDLEIQNFAVPSYGLDQSLLRYQRIATQPRTQSALGDEVWLGLLPGTLLRLVSVYRPALRHYTTTVAVKPRFRFDSDDHLELVPNPAGSLRDLTALLQTPERFANLAATDGFMIASPSAYAPNGSRLSHWFATSRLIITALERGGRDWAARTADPDDECHRLALAIILRFRDLAIAEQRLFRVILLPDRESLGPPLKPWDNLLDAVRTAGIEVFDTTDALEKAVAAAGASSAKPSLWAPHGHYSAAGNTVVATVISEALK